MLCPFCLKNAEGDFCSHCGGDLRYQAGETQLSVGSVIKGQKTNYIIGAARGQGGFGITYAALDTVKNERVAIKEYFPIRCAIRNRDGSVSPKPGQEGEFGKGYDNFCKEANRLVGIKPLASVVNIWDNILANNTAYLVMEFVDGMPLHQKLSQLGGSIPAGELFPKLKPLMKDIDKLHRQGILHRDISPDNILWMNDGMLKLIDFGSSRSMEGDKSMTIMLKPGFAPVEQYLTHGQGPWTDVYGLGATIYYCLTGIMPPPALERLEQNTLKSPTALGVAISPEEESALLKAMETQPKNRFRSMGEFSAALFPHEIVKLNTSSGYEWELPNWDSTVNGKDEPINVIEPVPDVHEDDKTWVIGLASVIIIILLLILIISIIL